MYAGEKKKNKFLSRQRWINFYWNKIFGQKFDTYWDKHFSRPIEGEFN